MVNPRGGRHGEEGEEANRSRTQAGSGAGCRRARLRDPIRVEEDRPVKGRSEKGRQKGWCRPQARRAAAGTLTLMPSGAHVSAAMIAHRADHTELQLIEGDLVGKTARVYEGVLMAARVRAVDENFGVSERPLLGQRQWLIV